MYSSRFKDLTGKTFGERTVVSYSHQRADSGNYYWNVVCSCGREGVVSGSRLKKGSMCTSCSGRVNGRKGLYSKSSKYPVYFIQCGEYIKIGSSSDISRRVKDIESDNPFKITLVKIDNNHSEEYWHIKFKKHHHKGEWYKMGVCEIVDV